MWSHCRDVEMCVVIGAFVFGDAVVVGGVIVVAFVGVMVVVIVVGASDNCCDGVLECDKVIFVEFAVAVVVCVACF